MKDTIPEIPIAIILKDAGYIPEKRLNDGYLFRAFWGGREGDSEDDKKGVIHINTSTNQWYFFGGGGDSDRHFGGGIVKLLLQLKLIDSRTGDAKQYLEDTYPELVGKKPDEIVDPFAGMDFGKNRPGESSLTLISAKEPRSKSLIRMLDKAWIPLDVAKRYCKEVTFLHGSIPSTGIGLPTDNGGYVVCCGSKTYVIGASGITTIKGSDAGKNELVLLPGIIDFLSYQSLNWDMACDIIVLNSEGMIRHSGIDDWKYEKVYSYIGKNRTGLYALGVLRKKLGERLVDMAGIKLDGKESIHAYVRRLYQEPHKTIAVVGTGRECGKTTTCYNLTWFYATLSMKVLLIDMDPSGALSSMFQVNWSNTIYDSLLDTNVLSPTLVTPNLYVVPSDNRLAGIGAFVNSSALREMVLTAKNEYDIIIIDCASDEGPGFYSTLKAADEAVILARAEISDIDEFERTAECIERVREEVRPHILGTVITRRKRTKGSAKAKGILLTKIGNTLLETEVRESAQIAEAIKKNKPALSISNQSNGYNDYHNLAFEILKKLKETNI